MRDSWLPTYPFYSGFNFVFFPFFPFLDGDILLFVKFLFYLYTGCARGINLVKDTWT